MTMWIVIGIGDVGDCIHGVLFSLSDVSRCANMSVIEINHLTLSNGFYLFSVVGAGLVGFFPF